MLRVLSLSFLVLFFLSCSGEDSSNSNVSQHENLRILKAPSGSLISIFQIFSLSASAELDETTVNSSTVYILDQNNTRIDARVKLDPLAKTDIYIEPYHYFEPSSDYTLVVTTSLKDLNGRSLSTNFTYSFVTGLDIFNPNTSLNLVKTNPSDGSLAFNNTHITFGFDRFIAPSDNPPFSVIDKNTSKEISGGFEYINSEIVFIPDSELLPGHEIEVSLINYPTDMYANDFNTSSGDVISFKIEDSSVGNNGWEENTTLRLATNKISHKIRYIGYDQHFFDYVAVAREGGVDIYKFNYDTKTWDGGVYHSIEIASEITDMVYTKYTNTEYLLVSTAKDGIYVTNVTDKTAISSAQYMQNIGFIYGTGYSKTLNDVDRVYAVGPNIGMYVFELGTDGTLNQINQVAISGEPLKVVSSTTESSDIYVSDYRNGVRVYDKNGTYKSLLSFNTPVKHMLGVYNGSNNEIYTTDYLGDVYKSNVDTMSPFNDLLALPSYINDVYTSNSESVCFSLGPKGLYCYGYYQNFSTDFYIYSNNQDIISATDLGYEFMLTLSKEGVINVYNNTNYIY